MRLLKEFSAVDITIAWRCIPLSEYTREISQKCGVSFSAPRQFPLPLEFQYQVCLFNENYTHFKSNKQLKKILELAQSILFAGYINVGCGGKSGYYFSSLCVIVGSFALFLIDLHKRNLSKHKHTKNNGTTNSCVSTNCPQRRRLSFSQEPDHDGMVGNVAASALAADAELPAGHGECILYYYFIVC